MTKDPMRIRINKSKLGNKDMSKTFAPLPEDMAVKFNNAGKGIYLYLKDKYPEEAVHDLDIILNSLCIALTHLTISRVDPDDFEAFLQLIHKILSNNLRQYKDGLKGSDNES